MIPVKSLHKSCAVLKANTSSFVFMLVILFATSALGYNQDFAIFCNPFNKISVTVCITSLLILSSVCCAWWAYRKRIPIIPECKKLWAFFATACLFNAIGNLSLLKSTACVFSSILSTLGLICLLWGIFKQLSLAFWGTFLLFVIAQAATYVQFGALLRSEIVLSEIFDASLADILSYITFQNTLAIIICLSISIFATLLIYRCTRNIQRFTLITFGMITLSLSFIEIYMTAPTHRNKCLPNLWTLYEVYQTASNIKKALTLNDELIKYVNDLPSPSEKSASMRTLSGSQGVVLIIHIGESVRADRLTLNGYANKGRSTTPWLDAQKGRSLINFSNCISSTPFTCPSLITILTDARRDVRHNKENIYKARAGSILDIFDACQFSVYSFLGTSASLTGKYNKVTTLLASSSKEKYYAPALSHTILPFVQHVLKRNSHENMVLFIQNEGSHAPFSAYDTEHAPFQPTRRSINSPQQYTEELNNAYDNTIYYTDSYIHKLADMLKKRPYLYLYISDHGEYAGHDGYWFRTALAANEKEYHNTTGSRVGMFIITSPEFEALHPHFAGAVKNLRKHKDMTVGHEHIYHTLLGIFGISTPYYDAKLDLSGENPEPYTGPQPQTPPQPDAFPATLQPAA